MMLNKQQITEKIKKEIKICIEMNENENTTTQNLWDTVKVVLRDWGQEEKGTTEDEMAGWHH